MIPYLARLTGRPSGGRLFGFATTPSVFADACLLEHDFERAEVRKGRLQQVEANERGEPKPVLAVIVREHEAEEDKQTGEPADDHVHFHNSITAIIEP
jgi:hypothetical protein